MLKWWNEFNNWAATWWPGAKTKILGIATVIASTGAAIMPFLTDAPWQWDLIVGKYAPYVGMGVGILAIWFRMLSKRFKEMQDVAMVNIPVRRAAAGDNPRDRASARRLKQDE